MGIQATHASRETIVIVTENKDGRGHAQFICLYSSEGP